MIRNHFIVDKAPLDGIPMDSWNRAQEAANIVLDSNWRANDRPFGRPLSWVKNNTGADRERGDVVGLNGVVIDSGDNAEEYQNRVVYSGIEPASPAHDTKYAILQQPTPTTISMPAMISGVTLAKVNVTDVGHEFCKLVNAKYELESADNGSARLLHAPGTGTQLCWVRLGEASGGGDELYDFTLTEDMGATTAGQASATVTKPDGSGSGTQTVKDHPAGIFSILKSGARGWVVKVGSDYWIIQANCPPTAYEESSGNGSLAGSGTFILVPTP